MTEQNESTQRTVDVTKPGPGMSHLSRKLAEVLGESPLLVQLELKDGEFTPESIQRLGEAITGRLESRGAPSALVADLRRTIGDLAANPSRVTAARPIITETKRQEVLAKVRAARELLCDTDDVLLAMAQERVKTVTDPDALGEGSYKLGIAASSLIDVLNGLSDVEQALTAHILTCPCTTEPATEPAAPAPAPETTPGDA